MKWFRNIHPARAVLVTAVLAFIIGIAVFVRHVSAPRVVARAVSPDGVEMCIVQQCNWSAEPFTTSFVYRRPGGQWGRFYFDHQDIYWGRSRVSLDTNAQRAVFYRGGSPAVTFSWPSETYTMHGWNRTMTGAQWQMPAGGSPQMPVH